MVCVWDYNSRSTEYEAAERNTPMLRNLLFVSKALIVGLITTSADCNPARDKRM